MEMGADAVEFEVFHVVVLHHLGAAAHEGIEVFLVGKLEVADLVVRMLDVPVGEALAFGGSIAAHRTQPCSDACLLPGGGGINALEALREHFVEVPQTVEFVPPVIPYEGINGRAAFLEKLLLPVFQHGQALLFRHAPGGVGVVVAVDVQLIPGVVMDEGAVGHGALPFHVREEGPALLPGGEETYNGGYVPDFPGLEGCLAAPDALRHSGVRRQGVFLLRGGYGQGESDFPLAGDRLRLCFHPVAQHVAAPGGNLDLVGIAGAGVSRSAGMEIGIKDGSLRGQELHPGEVQLVVSPVASCVPERNREIALAADGDGSFRGGKMVPVLFFQFPGDVEIARPGVFHPFVRFPVRAAVPGISRVSRVSRGIDAHGCFQRGECQVIDNERSPGVAGNAWFPGLPADEVILHGHDVFHLNGLGAHQPQFLAQVVGIVPQYGAPGNAQRAVQRLKGGRQGFARVAFRESERLGIGRQVGNFDVGRLQFGRFDAPSVCQVDDEQFSPRLGDGAQFGRETAKGNAAVFIQEFGCQDAVGKSIGGAGLYCSGGSGRRSREDDSRRGCGQHGRYGGQYKNSVEEFHGAE